jgi:hypothetical protein
MAWGEPLASRQVTTYASPAHFEAPYGETGAGNDVLRRRERSAIPIQRAAGGGEDDTGPVIRTPADLAAARAREIEGAHVSGRSISVVVCVPQARARGAFGSAADCASIALESLRELGTPQPRLRIEWPLALRVCACTSAFRSIEAPTRSP